MPYIMIYTSKGCICMWHVCDMTSCMSHTHSHSHVMWYICHTGCHVIHKSFVWHVGSVWMSCYTYRSDMSHKWLSHITHIIGAWHTYKGVMSYRRSFWRLIWSVRIRRARKTWQHTATHCNTLQHDATPKKLLTIDTKRQNQTCPQHTTTHCSTLQHRRSF